jgi:hypothetical protein
MLRITTRTLRYGVAVAVSTVAVVGLFSTLGVIYTVVSLIAEPLPTFTVHDVAAALASPLFYLGLVSIVGVTTLYGYQRYGTLLGFFVSCVKLADSVVGLGVFDEPVLRGRVAPKDIAWTVEYWEDGRVKADEPCCPRCGSELEPQHLPEVVAHGANEGLNPHEDRLEQETEGWVDIHGAPKTESTREVPALACALCRFSVPGRREVEEGKTTAEKVFKNHVQRMKSGNPKSQPFAEYQPADGEPLGPEGVWDAYAAPKENPELIPFSLETNRGGGHA